MQHEEDLIAPCGMNCRLCIHYQFMRGDLNKAGFSRSYCPGCLPRGKNCTHMADSCAVIGTGGVRFCHECGDFPCKRLKALDKRYRDKYHMSMIENLNAIRQNGMDAFLRDQATVWRCPSCDDVRCCHNGLCLSCALEKLKENKKYCWNE